MSSTETSLRVVVRARPMNARETREGAQRCIEYFESTGQILINGAASFTFDKVFPDTVDQEMVYEETAHPLLDRVFAGFNATILAYGQTGSGKTYTMGTEDNDGTDEIRRGIIPRLVNSLFKRINATDTPESFKVTVSMFEVYSDNVYDLLRPDKIKLNVHGDEKGCTIVNLTAVPVIDLKGALKQLATGCHYRTKAETAMNAMSSRSHAVFTIVVEKQATDENEQAFSSKLQLVDLAGSERLKKTEAEGNRMKEGININSGLLILSQVISALATKQKHIPYRNSVITRVLQDSLGGNSFTVFLACISPADTNSQETLNTLRYADRAKQIKNKPIVNKNPKAEEVSYLRSQIKRLEKENEDLRKGIAPGESKVADLAKSAEILALKEELAIKEDEARERCMKLSECIVKINALSNRVVRLESDKSKMASIINDLKTSITNEEMLPASEIVANMEKILTSESDATVLGDDDNGDETNLMDDTLYDTERLPKLQQELDDIERQISLKDENRRKELETHMEIVQTLQKREEEKTQLVVHISELESEIAKLRNETKKVTNVTKLSEERRLKLKELEKQEAESKKRLNDMRKLQETSKKMEEAHKRLEEELSRLKMQRLRLLKEQRAEANKFKAFKLKHEREMQQMKTKHQKRELEVARQKRIDEQKFSVLQQRLAESVRANKALKELNMKRANRKGTPVPSNELQAAVDEEFEVEAASHKCHCLVVELRKQRSQIQEQINKTESEKFEGRKKRRVSADPDVSVVLEGEEEFEEERKKKLEALYSSLSDVNAQIEDLLKNSTISDNSGKSSKFDRIPAELRQVFDALLHKGISFMKKEIDLEFQIAKQRSDFTAKLEARKKNEEERVKNDKLLNEKYVQLTENLEASKSELHQKLTFLIQLIRADKIDEAALRQFEVLRNQYCDIEQKIKKCRVRKTTNFVGGLTPKPELKRNERARKAVARYGNAISSDVTFDDFALPKRNRSSRSSSRTELLNKVTDENVRKRVPMSPIRFDDETRLSEDEHEDVEMANDENQVFNATFVKDGSTPKSPSPLSENNGTFVIGEAPPGAEDISIPPLRRASRKTTLGPL
ncbi:unnamed protein product [Caenorhabditis bovis]|uniref:Kinesin motor domain-containing protein n=1 Tax=Caenorhabditis bovis TaxID=2654633 RepID=A0A8S1F5I5_9PELO|nr:unnamed protein product [Caenorhabditis bovis]